MKGIATTGAALAALALLVATPWPNAQAQAPAFSPKDEMPEMFPDHPGREETVGFCSGCHGFKLVAAQGMNRRQWDVTLNFMTEKHNMPAIEGEDRARVLDYLETAFPPKARQGGFSNPFTE